eukprot:TRINITY_DN462_c0_g1_i2.p1 TRINITY_DN462_c0_g1~~TRINITY_DN462_c0_g1_i2.p1  ORF type:complete len:314 (-),score=35.25 TRINITY_DN462_c0_g1_i2:262-1203(-)
MAGTPPDFVDVPDYILPEDEDEDKGPLGAVTPPADPLLPIHAGTSKWRISKILGKGSSAVVYLACNERGKTVAVKVIHLPTSETEDRIRQEVERIKKEITALRAAGGHRNVVVYYHFHAQAERVNMFFEYCPQGSLWRKYAKEGALPVAAAARYTRHIASGLAWVHKQGVVHRDLKCLNILLAEGDVAKLTDFGSAVIIGAVSQQTVVGTLLWMAPEVLLRNGHRWQADIWSLGCTVIEMITAAKPFSHLFKARDFLNPVNVAQMHQLTPAELCPAVLDPLARDFILKCLVKERRHRPQAEALLLHPFLAKRR